MALVVCTVKCSEILAHIELSKNPIEYKVFYILFYPHKEQLFRKFEHKISYSVVLGDQSLYCAYE